MGHSGAAVAGGHRTPTTYGRAGFTLIEIMIVCAIIAVLAAIAVPHFKAAREKAHMRACYENQRKIAGAIEMYNLDLNSRISAISADFLNTLVSRQYLKTYPIDPATGDRDAYSIVTLSGDKSSVVCRFHGSVE